MSKGTWVFGYLKDHILAFILYLSFIILFPFVNYLYGFPTEAVTYGGIIVTLFMVLVLGVDMSFYYRKIKDIRKRKEYQEILYSDFTAPINSIEAEYQDYLKSLYKKIRNVLDAKEEQSDEMMTYYMNWAHQIKTPISALYLLLQREEEEGMNVATMKQELFRIEQYVDMVMQYLRIDHVADDLDLYEIPIKNVVQSCVKKYSSIFISKRISLKLEEMDQKVISDEKWLMLMIEQLLSNALKYTSKGSIHIYMETDDQLIIEDTGIGIRQEDIHRIFEKGFTGKNGRIDQKASGLGLFLCRKVGDKLQIKIAITSKLGIGTKVTLTFIKEPLELIDF